MTKAQRRGGPWPACSPAPTKALVLVCLVLCTRGGAEASIAPRTSEHSFARARFELAAQDTFATARALEEALDRAPSDAMRARALVLLQVFEGSTAAAPTSLEEPAHEWLAAFAPSLADPLHVAATSKVRLLGGARAIDLADLRAAHAWLDGARPPEELELLHLHLQAQLAQIEGDVPTARARWREIASAKTHDARVELIAHAALRLAASATAHGEDPATWIARVPASSSLAPRAELVAVLLDAPGVTRSVTDARLTQWLDAHPDHPAADEARSHRVALALDHGDFAGARDRARARERSLTDEREALESAQRDSTRLLATADALWARPVPTAARIGADNWHAALVDLTRRLTAPEGDWPSTDGALRLDAPRTFEVERSGLELEPSDVARDAALADSLHHAHRSLMAAQRAEAALRDEIARRLAYHGRGAQALDAVADSLRRALGELATLGERGPALLADLRAVEDTLMVRIDRRSRALAERARTQAEAASGVRWLYAEGPMARRDPAPHADVPVPSELLRDERALADAIHGTVDTLRVRSRALVRRSFSEVFARRVTLGTDAAARWARRLLDRDASLVTVLDSTRTGLASDPRLAALDANVNAAARGLAGLQATRDRHRLAATERALTRALATIDARMEGLLYTLAVATTELAVGADDESARALRPQAQALWQRFLALDPDPRVRGDARYRWADLELVLARATFQQRMGDWLDREGADERALAPLLDIEPALDLFRTLLVEDPGFAQRDLVLFQLGMLLADRGDAQAEEFLARLVDEFPDSAVLQEAHLRRGELAFDAEDHRRALGHLRAAAQGPDAQVAAIALYKLGWSANTLGEVSVAIDAFLQLADLYADAEHAPRRIDLESESRALLLRSIARDGGADAFARTFDAAGERSFAPALLSELSSLLTGYAMDEQAAAADRLFLTRYPLDAGALAAADRLVLSAERERGVDAGDAARLDVFESFVSTSAWSRAQEVDSLRVQGDAFARDAVVTVAVRAHQRARTSEHQGDFAAALTHYDRLLAGWPEHEEAPRWSLLAGECARTLGEYRVALDRFDRAASAAGEFADEATWQGVATADQWYRTSIAPGAAAGVDSLARRLLQRGDAIEVGDVERRADLQWRLAQVALAHAWDEEVAPRFAAFAAAYPADPRALRAKTLHAESVYRGGRYDLASMAFEAAVQGAAAAGADSLAQALLPWIAHSEDLHAEQVAADPNRGLAEAAPLWRALAHRWPDFAEADRALYRAGLGFEQASADSNAVEAWSTLLVAHPTSEYAPDAHRNLARHHEDRGRLDLAATAIERYAAAYPAADDAGEALLHAVGLRERSGDHAGRTRTLDLYLQHDPEDLATRQWVLEERAVAELDADIEGEAVKAWRSFAEQNPELASAALFSRIELRQAERTVSTFETIALTQPLPASLERKRDALTRLLEAYRSVAERGVTPYAQTAAFRIGDALVHMGDALLSSERPENLRGDDLIAYDEVLASQAWSFTERGEDAWRELLRAHAKSDDPALAPWIASTRAALFPRTAQRFLHRPSFEYPVLDAASSGR